MKHMYISVDRFLLSEHAPGSRENIPELSPRAVKMGILECRPI